MIVIDVGCTYHPNADSVDYLLERFHPTVLYGFDPLVSERNDTVGDTRVILTASAAWVRDGTIRFARDGARSRINLTGEEQVPCFDFSSWLRAVPDSGNEIVLKIDAERAEYALLERLIADELDHRLARVLVEWHEGPFDWKRRQGSILDRISCPVEDWKL